MRKLLGRWDGGPRLVRQRCGAPSPGKAANDLTIWQTLGRPSLGLRPARSCVATIQAPILPDSRPFATVERGKKVGVCRSCLPHGTSWVREAKVPPGRRDLPCYNPAVPNPYESQG